MITNCYGVNSVEDAFDFALKINLTFKGIVCVKAWEQCSKCERYEHYNYWCIYWEQCSKCEGYGHYSYQCPSESRHVNILPSDDDDLKVVEVVHVHSENFLYR